MKSKIRMNLASRRLISLVTVACMVLSTFNAASFCVEGKTEAKALNTPSFADYKAPKSFVKPNVKPYKVKSNLSNVVNVKDFKIREKAKRLLSKNGFAVDAKSGYNEFFEIYESNRYLSVPNFITTDSILHNYHLYFAYMLKTIEKGKLGNELRTLSKGMLKQSVLQYDSLKNTEWENAAKRNVAYFSVANALLDDKFNIPESVKNVVEKELELINAHKETVASPVINLGHSDKIDKLPEDYTQYIPRGHYDGNKKLEQYFKAMMWYGRMTFRTFNQDETKSALLLVLAAQNTQNAVSYEKIYSTTAFFAGESDDPGCGEIDNLIEKSYGKNVTSDKIKSDKNSWDKFYTLMKSLKGPAINSIPIFDKSIQPDREKVITGFRFMGQRYSLDAEIFQRLIYRDVEENSLGNRRLLPMSLDVPAAFGSRESQSLLRGYGAYDYKNYEENMVKLQATVKNFKASSWNKNLYSSWLGILKEYTTKSKKGNPSFMLNTAWERKNINSFLGSYTELKHDTVLYSKQAMAEMGSAPEANKPVAGYVEPNSAVYAKLAGLSNMTRVGLEKRGLIEKRDIKNLKILEDLSLKLYTISEKELSNKKLTKSDFNLIRYYGGNLEHFWLETLRDEKGTLSSLILENPASLAADIATGDNKALETANGDIQRIYVIVPLNGKLVLTSGGIFSNYSFSVPASQRLTDKKWRVMLKSDNAPKLPDWTGIYTYFDRGIQLKY